MKVYAIYDKSNKFIIAFPTREETEEYGKVFLGSDKGWEYDIREMFLYGTQQYQFPQPTQPIAVPYTKPIPLKTSPYEPNIWCEVNGGVKPTFTKEGPFGPTGIPGPSGQVVSHSSPVDSGPFAPGTK